MVQMTGLWVTLRNRIGLVLISSYAALGASCPPAPTVPISPNILAPTVNANLPVRAANADATTVFFSKIPWQETDRRGGYYAFATYPDLLVTSAYSFQISVDWSFSSGTFHIYDEGGNDIPLQVPRVNLDTGSYPGAPGWITRPVPVAEAPAASIEVAALCNGAPTYGQPIGFCSPPRVYQPALLVTLKPPTSQLVHGQSYSFTMAWENSLGKATRKFKAVYVEPGRCKTPSFVTGPATANAYESRTLEWFVNDCYAMSVSLIDPSTQPVAG